MDCRAETRGDLDILHCAGRLDLVGSSTLKDQVRQRLQNRRANLIINCAGLDFINSSGLGALISALKDVRVTSGCIVLCGLVPYVDEVFEITGLKKVFDVYADVDDAAESFARPSRKRVGTA